MDNVISFNLAETVRAIQIHGPTRVIVNENGLAVSPKQIRGEKVDIVFIRFDGWSLGASDKLAFTAYKQWATQWVYVLRTGQEQAVHISMWEPDGTGIDSKV